MKWLLNSGWWLGKRHTHVSSRYSSVSSRHPRISSRHPRVGEGLVAIALLVSLSSLLMSCTDYVQQIDDRYGEWETSDSIVKSSSSNRHSGLDPESSSSAAKSSSSSVAKSSSSSAKPSSSSVPSSSSSVTPKSSSSKKVESSSSKVTEPAEVTTGSMTDSRDGHTYKTVTFGSQTWMAENLNYETANSYCYNDNASNCSKYGRLYTWAAAMDSAGTWSTNGKGCGYNKTCSPTYPVRGVCPQGWHLPTQTEWNTLFNAVGGSSVAGAKLKSTSGWYNSGNGTDAFSFSALPAGYRISNGNYDNEGFSAYFWSSTESNSIIAYGMRLYYDYDRAALNGNLKYYGLSVRCLKD